MSRFLLIASSPPRPFAAVIILFCCVALSHAAGLSVVTLSLEDYTKRAIEKGIQGRENALRFESAGYTREIAFRQTDSPSFSADGSVTRSGVEPGTGPASRTDTAQGSLNYEQLLPTGTELDATGQITGIDNAGSAAGSNQKVFSASVSQPLYVFVKNSVMRTRRQADIAFASARDDYEATRLSLRSQARSFYYQVMLGEESIKVEERKVTSSKKLLDITQALVQGGRTAPVETMRAKIRFQTDQRQLQDVTVNRAQAVLNAKNFIYVPLESDIVFSSRLEFKPFQPPLERLVQYALLHNPQLRILDRRRELARLDLQTERETTRPNLSLDGDYVYNEASSGSSSALTRRWNLGANASWLFFDSFITKHAVSRAQIDVMVADLNLAEAQRNVQLNVNSAYLDIKNAEQQILDFTASIDQARHNVEVLRLRFKNGLERLIDVFDAENDMRDLDNQYLGLLVSFNQRKDALSQLLGADVETIR